MKGRVTILALLAAVIGSGAAQVTREDAASRAADFLLRSRSAETMSWRPREAAAAFLALTANRPGEWKYSSNLSADKIATKNGVRMALLQLISSKDGYGGLDHSQLSQFLGALKVLCEDTRSFAGGHDLIAEAERRAARGLPPASPANAGLAITLCTAGVRVPESLLNKLLLPKVSRMCNDLCFERAALNVLALSCVFREKDFDYDTRKVELLLRSNIDRVTTDAAEPGFLHAPANIFRLSLLLQVLEVSPFVVAVDEAAVLRRLISLQRANGSFGDSVGVTAAVVPALARASSADIKNIRCFKKDDVSLRAPEGMVAIRYEISEDAFKSQAFVGQMVAPEGATLLEALQRYEQQYPEVLHIKVKESSFGAFISEVNDVKNRRRLTWRVVGGKEQDIGKIRVRQGETYRISYRRV